MSIFILNAVALGGKGGGWLKIQDQILILSTATADRRCQPFAYKVQFCTATDTTGAKSLSLNIPASSIRLNKRSVGKKRMRDLKNEFLAWTLIADKFNF